MQLKDFLNHGTAIATGTKEHATRKGPADTNPTIITYRGHEPIAVITLPGGHDVQWMMNACAMAATSFEADVLTFIAEAWASPTVEKAHPITGEDLVRGDMDQLAADPAMRERLHLQELIGVSVINRAGDFLYAGRIYRYSGKHLVWESEAIVSPSDYGYIPRRLREIMAEPTLSVTMEDIHQYGDRNDLDVMVAEQITERLHSHVILFADTADIARLRKFRTLDETLEEYGD